MNTMKTTELIKEIHNLPIQDQMFVIEKTLHLMRRMEDSSQLKNAADTLYNDYKSDTELTSFSVLDVENFYETR
jgi:hypothetical protein